MKLFIIITNAIKVVLPIVIFLIIYLMLDRFKEYRLDKTIQKGFDKLTEKEKLAKLKLKQMEYYVSKSQKHNYLNRLQLVILKSNINERLKIITPEILIIISIIAALLSFLIAFIKIEVLFPSILIGVVGYRIPTLLLVLLAEGQSLNIDKRLVEFINILINFCCVKNDIVYAINNAIPFLRYPLRGYCETFMYETKHGITPYDALENFKEKVDNKQFKLMMKNLQLCSRYSNQYLEVLRKSKDLILKYNKEHAKKRKEAKIGRISMLSMIAVCILIFTFLLNINPSLVNTLKTTAIGKLIISYIIGVCVLAFQVSMKISKFDY